MYFDYVTKKSNLHFLCVKENCKGVVCCIMCGRPDDTSIKVKNSLSPAKIGEKTNLQVTSAKLL